MFQVSAGPRLTRGDRLLMASVVVVSIALGAMVVWRSCFMQFRHTDFGVYARAGWAVQTGHDIYQVTDDGGLHYCYPPTFAIMMTPFAEPPTRAERHSYLPFFVSVALWYAMSVTFACLASHILASAIESTLPDKIDR